MDELGFLFILMESYHRQFACLKRVADVRHGQSGR